MTTRIPSLNKGQRGKQEVLDAAAFAFMERGYAGTSIDDIAAIAGATKGRVYHYWRSKSDLFFDILQSSLARGDAAVRPIYETGLDPARKLHDMSMAHLMQLFANFPAAKVGLQTIEHKLLSAAGIDEHRAMRRIINRRDKLEGMFRDVLAEGVDAGVFRKEEPAMLAKVLLGALNWPTMWFDTKRPTTPEKIQSIAETHATFVVNGVLIR